MKKEEKYLTSLSGERMVSKTHGRIVFRGLIDTLEAEVIEVQVLAAAQGADALCANLGEVLNYLRSLMAAEVREAPLPPPALFGLNAEELHRQSHAGSIPLPSYTQGPLAARINTLRAKVREAELLAVKVFGGTGADGTEAGKTEEREDIILALNRLSSALWWLYGRVGE